MHTQAHGDGTRARHQVTLYPCPSSTHTGVDEWSRRRLLVFVKESQLETERQRARQTEMTSSSYSHPSCCTHTIKPDHLHNFFHLFRRGGDDSVLSRFLGKEVRPRPQPSPHACSPHVPPHCPPLVIMSCNLPIFLIYNCTHAYTHANTHVLTNIHIYTYECRPTLMPAHTYE